VSNPRNIRRMYSYYFLFLLVLVLLAYFYQYRLNTAEDKALAQTEAPVYTFKEPPDNSGGHIGTPAGFYVRLSCFATPVEATDFRARVVRKLPGLQGRMHITQESTFCVLVGPYAERKLAVGAGRRLAELLKIRNVEVAAFD